MRSPLLAIYLLMSTLMFSCKDASVNDSDKGASRALSLSASTLRGTPPCDITFTGTLDSYADSMRMRVPDMFLMGVPGKTIVRYSLPDTSVPVRKIYVRTERFNSQGIYSIHMVVQSIQGDIFSDTIAVTIE